MLKQWVRRLFGRNRDRRVKAPLRRARPRLEGLEERAVPTTCIWNGSVANTNWDDPNNWIGRVPQNGDDVVFNGATADAACARSTSSTSQTNFASVTVNGDYGGVIYLGGDASHSTFSWGVLNMSGPRG